MSTMTDKVVVVTGGGRGLGAAIARRFAGLGCRVVVADRDREAGGRIAAEIGGHAMATDVRDEDSVAALFDRCGSLFGRVDVLVNNAGIVAAHADTEHIDCAAWDDTFAANVRGAILCIKHAVPLMKASGGAILNMSSIVAERPDPRQAAYSASKAALLNLTRAVAEDLGRYGIRVVALAPGPVATEALLERARARAQEEGRSLDRALSDDFIDRTALGRLLDTEDVVETAIFLAGDGGCGITGTQIDINAGWRNWPGSTQAREPAAGGGAAEE